MLTDSLGTLGKRVNGATTNFFGLETEEWRAMVRLTNCLRIGVVRCEDLSEVVDYQRLR